MRNPTHLRRVPAAAIPMLMSVAVLAGCGDDDDNSSAADSNGATDLQSESVRVVERVSPQVVQIQTDKGLGSGIVNDAHGDIVINAHVTGDARRFLVTLADGDHRQGTLVGSDASNDIAVIRVSGDAPHPQGIVSSLNRQVSEGDGVTSGSPAEATP